jgi:hypothetical protein
MGNYDRYERVVAGTPFYFVFVDHGVGFEAKVQGFVDQLAAIAKVYHRMFRSFPFEDYTFVMSLNPQASWGLEHLTSTMCGLGPDIFTDPDQYAIGVRVCAHELFHAWNVRRLRPSPLLQVAEQLTSGSFTEGLWIAEGFTRYYEFLSCTRIGVYSPDQFFSAVVGYLEHLRVVPAYERVSGVDSSLTTYLNHSPKYSGRPANCIDYYDKGMLIAFDIDATLRLGSSEQSLDHAFRASFSVISSSRWMASVPAMMPPVLIMSSRPSRSGRPVGARSEAETGTRPSRQAQAGYEREWTRFTSRDPARRCSLSERLYRFVRFPAGRFRQVVSDNRFPIQRAGPQGNHRHYDPDPEKRSFYGCSGCRRAYGC